MSRSNVYSLHFQSIMKKIIYVIVVSWVTLFWQACEKYEMVQYGEGGEINFMGDYYRGQKTKPWWVDEVQYLNYEKNFGLNTLGDSLIFDTLQIGVKVMGIPVNHPRKVVFTTRAPKQHALEVIFPEEYYVPADTGVAVFKVLVKRPAERNAVYTADLVFDYARSDFKAGTDERQVFPLKARDEVTMELWGITEEEWEYYGIFFGDYSETKARFLITAFGCVSFNDWTMEDEFMDIVFGNTLYDMLEEYKSDPSNPPLIDEHTGEWIEFPDLSEIL